MYAHFLDLEEQAFSAILDPGQIKSVMANGNDDTNEGRHEHEHRYDPGSEST